MRSAARLGAAAGGLAERRVPGGGPRRGPGDRARAAPLPEARARDRPAFVELYASPEVHAYLGGA
ncbi:hypothetical protein ABZ114_24680, partial [Streptomyces albidoflavus]